jgi:2-iminobutanoate/2-iminopropanoate deaminase
MTKKVFHSERAPLPAGTYSLAIEAGGFVFLSGQTPRDRENVRHGDKPFSFQARMAMDNLAAAANAAGLSLADAVKVGVFLKNPKNANVFDKIYAEYVSDPPPARTLTQSNFSNFDIEVDAILCRPLAVR